MKSYHLMPLGLLCSIGLTSCWSNQKRNEKEDQQVSRSAAQGAHAANLHYFSEYVTRDQSLVEIFKTLIQQGTVLVDFYADWCGPCKRLGAALESMAAEFADILIIKVNVDTYPEIAQLYNVISLPTMLFFKNSVLVHRATGFEGPGALRAMLGRLY